MKVLTRDNWFVLVFSVIMWVTLTNSFNSHLFEREASVQISAIALILAQALLLIFRKSLIIKIIAVFIVCIFYTNLCRLTVTHYSGRGHDKAYHAHDIKGGLEDKL